MTEDPRRKDDVLIYRIDQKLDDFIKRFDEHLAWNTETEKRITAAEVILNQINRPMKAIGWAITIFVSGALVWLGERVVSFLWGHWK